jgi:adenylate cyclase
MGESNLERRMPRQIATVVSADAIGFSKLMHEDDETALKLFDARLALIVEAVERAGGSIFGAAGDSVMALFGNPIIALGAVLQFQEAIAGANALEPSNRSMPFRAGISVGPVVVRPDGVFGDAVNIAARVQEFSPQGGVALSEFAYAQVKDMAETTFVDVGPIQLKNIATPVRIYISDSSGGAAAVIRFGAASPRLDEAAPSGEPPALAVLPFENLTGDPGLAYLCDAIAGDILLGIANTRSIRVISQGSSFQFRDQSFSTAMIGRLLGARYLVSGSVGGDNSRLVLNASVADSSSSSVIWSGRFERELAEVQKLQRQIGGELVARLEREVERVEQVRTFQVPPESLRPWQLLRRGRWHMQRRTSADATKALEYFNLAYEEDPNSSVTLNELAWWHLWAAWLRFGDRDELKIVANYARRALFMDSVDARSYCYLGLVEILELRPRSAVDFFRQSLEINPSSTLTRTGLGSAKALLLETGEAIHQLNEAIRLSPFEGYLFHCLGELAAAYTIKGDWERAIDAADRSLLLAPNYFYASYLRAGALARLGRRQEAREAAALFRARHPEFEPSWVEWIPFVDHAINAGMIENFSLAEGGRP